MNRREVKGPSSTDLLVCFPTRSHLTLMPKTISSASKHSNTQRHRHLHHHNHGKSIGDGGGLWSKKNHMGSELSEPTSPKVTCAGQIKARPKSVPCKNWQSVMEEIERLHNNKKHRKRSTWGGALGFKKESMQFLTCLRSFKFDLGCFGAFPNADVTSDEDQEDDDEEEEINHDNRLMGFRVYDHDDLHHEEGSSRSAFSKFFMVLEKNQDCGLLEKDETDKPKDDDEEEVEVEVEVADAQAPCMPPSNALLLMRCRSAPAKSWSEEKEEEEEHDDDDHDHDDGKEHDDNDGEDDDEMKRENLMEVIKYEGDFYKLSCDIAKETWVVGGINKDPFSRTQSSKRCSTECLQEVKACLQ